MEYIHVKVTTGAKKESFVQKSKDHFLVSDKEKAERNMANRRVLALVALRFKVLKNKVRIVNGYRHPSKLLIIDGLSPRK